MDKNIAIHVKNVSKTFRIPREKITSLRGAATSLFKDHSYEEFKALDGVSFDVKKGEFFGIIGRNGSGKSTLLKILAGIYTPDKGTVKVNGLISPFLELGIGFNPELSGRDNVFLNATVLGLTQKEISNKFDAIVKFAELERFIDQKLKNYSSGMQVRLAFAVSIFANREILLMDEVLAVGDNNFQSKCLEEFNKYKKMGRTVIIVTHDVSVVERYCDRAMLLRNGKIEKIGKPGKVVAEYIEQNMSDEDRRLRDEEKARIQEEEKIAKKMAAKQRAVEMQRLAEEKQKMEEERKKKAIQITAVEFFDGQQRRKRVFGTGDNLCIRISFVQRKPIDEKINFGIAILNCDDICYFGTNTFIYDVDTTKAKERGYIDIIYPSISLRNNSYYVTVGIWGDTLAKPLDHVAEVAKFKVMSSDDYIGMVHMEHLWK